MLAADEDALICDLAETYGIFDYRALPVPLLATLAVGLRDNSRIKMRLCGSAVAQDTMLLAAAVDKLTFLAWAKTKDAQSGRNRPQSIWAALLGREKSKSAVVAFDTAAEFEAARAEILGAKPDGN